MILAGVEIKMYPAGSGDCILIHFQKENFRILIDGGFKNCFDTKLKEDLKSLSKEGHKLNLVIVSHIDRDHINGIRALLEANGDCEPRKIISIDEIWFNGFKHMPFDQVKDKSTLIPFSEKGILRNMAANLTEKEENGEHDVAFVDGESLAELITSNQYSWNSSFDLKVEQENKVVYREKNAVSHDIKSIIQFGDIKIHILNPGKKELNDLAEKWINDLKNRCQNVVITENCLFDRAFEGVFYCHQEDDGEVKDVSQEKTSKIDWKKAADKTGIKKDKSEENLSSIAIMIEYQNKLFLFPGDCPTGKIEEKLPTKIDVVKLPHHGSEKSTEKSFIRNHEIDYYLISTNGTTFSHPSKSIVGNILCYGSGKKEIRKNYDNPILQNIGVYEEVEKNEPN